MKDKFIIPLILIVLFGCIGVMGAGFINTEKTESVETNACNTYGVETIYLLIGEEYELPELEKGGFFSKKHVYVTNGDHVKLNDCIVTAVSTGTTAVSADCKDYQFVVTDLYTSPVLSNDKPFLGCGQYSKEENDILDKALSYKIRNAGYGSRAGVVEAMRFLLLQFPYRMKYFYENGRLELRYENSSFADGEGRYYHKGLYLDESRFEKLDKEGMIQGPQTWGCPMYCEPDESEIENGFDCSGLITWALYNGGFDVKDIGAGPTENDNDLTDLGVKTDIKDVKVETLKPGDLVGFDGHIGMIIGIDEEHIYICESYWNGDLQVNEFTYSKFIKGSQWKYVMLMDTYYKKDGNLTYMW